MRRKRFKPLLQVGLAVWTLARVLAAQEAATDPALLLRADLEQRKRWATEWLASDVPQRVAWGAWLARQDHQEHQTTFIPELLKKVEQYQPDDNFSYSTTDRDGHDAMLAVLDAVIELRAPVPAEQAHRLYAEFPAQSLILLIRSRDNNVPALFDIFQKAKANWNWLAAGNVLVQKGPAGFAALLMNKFTQHLTVSIHDPGSVGGGGGIGSSCCYGTGGPKQGWPAVGLYELTRYPERFGTAATFLVSGDIPIYYLRTQPGNYDNRLDVKGSCDYASRDDYRAQYLMHLLGFSIPRTGLEPYSHLYVSWEGESPYRQRLIGAVNDRVALFHRAVLSLQQANLLTEAEAKSLKLRLEIVISDQRSDRSSSLPVILQDNEGVSIVANFSKPLD